MRTCLRAVCLSGSAPGNDRESTAEWAHIKGNTISHNPRRVAYLHQSSAGIPALFERRGSECSWSQAPPPDRPLGLCSEKKGTLGGPAGPGDGVGQCLAALRLCVNTSAPPRWENAPELLRRDGHKHNSIAFHQRQGPDPGPDPDQGPDPGSRPGQGARGPGARPDLGPD
ncbi:unnamed protein product [Gadus morhua 'NCC']